MTSTVGGVLIDPEGEAWPERSWAVAQRLDYRHPTLDLATSAVRHGGFVHLRFQGGGARIALRPGAVGLPALAGAIYALRAAAPPRILLALDDGEDCAYEMFSSLDEFAARAEQLAAAPPEPALRRIPWLAADRDLGALASPRFAKVRPLVELWQRNRGRLTEDLPTTLGALGLLHRTILVRQLPRSSRLVFEHYGAAIRIMRPCETLLAVGRDVDDIPDRNYGGWVAEAYSEALAGRRLRLESVRAVVRTSEAATLRSRYDRLLMPWRRSGGDLFLLSLSMVRELSVIA